MRRKNWRRIFAAALAAALSVPGKEYLLGNSVGAAFAAPTSSQDPEAGAVYSAIPQKKETSISLDGGKLVLSEGGRKRSGAKLPGEAYLVDSQATEKVRQVYAYLSAAGRTDGVIYGHQNDTWHKAGASPDGKNGLTDSDTADVAGSIAGIVGIDVLSLTGDEYSAQRYNAERCGADAAGGQGTEIDIGQLGQVAANVEAAARISNEAIDEGAIVTLSAHMPNFSLVEERVEYRPSRDPEYGKYDFSGYSPNVVTGNIMNELLPGGSCHEKYTAYLDMIADYAGRVDGAVLFRPFHENTGSWFWWGEAFCDPAAYRNVYRYTVEYLRDEKGVHNFLYVYSPGSEPESVEEYGIRYPGNAYVDMVGFDMYNSEPQEDNSQWMEQFRRQLDLVCRFAEKNGKLAAVTETGMSAAPADGDSQTALYRTGNKDPRWYQELLDIVSASDAAYFLLWANFSKTDGFYTPYVEEKKADGSLAGHELLDRFLEFCQDGRTIFAATQKEVLGQVPAAEARKAEGVASYLVTPVSGTRILEPTHFWAKIDSGWLSGEKRPEISFVLRAGENVKTIAAEPDGVGHYGIMLSAEELSALGEASGETDLVIDGQVCDTIRTIFNIPKPVREAWEVDDFEDYGGDAVLLSQEWATNKASGCAVSLSLSEEAGAEEGRFGLGLSYEEGPDGWAGVTTGRETDWSQWNALSFYTVPDGNNQKVVVQIQAGGITYEAYLNEYEEYQDSTDAMRVTIPFSQFCERDTAGQPKGGLAEHAGEISSFGLWVNAIPDSPAMAGGTVKGTICYDDIRAVTAEKETVIFEKLEGRRVPVSSGEIAHGGKEDGQDGQAAEEDSRKADVRATDGASENDVPWQAAAVLCGLALAALAGWTVVKKKTKK